MNVVTKYNVVCDCVQGEPSCEAVKKEVRDVIATQPKGVRCPSPYGSAPAITQKWGGETLKEPKLENGTLTFSSEPIYDSLIQPNHFLRIVGGFCPGSAGNYHECAAWAYKGTACNVPAACNTTSGFLGVKQ